MMTSVLGFTFSKLIHEALIFAVYFLHISKSTHRRSYHAFPVSLHISPRTSENFVEFHRPLLVTMRCILRASILSYMDSDRN